MAVAEPETLVGGLKRRLDRLVGHDDRSVKVLVTELKDLLLAYAKQETLGPLKSLVRWVLWGIIGAFFLALGTLLLTLAVVRLLQAETGSHLTGDLSWLPYVGGLIFALFVIGVAASRIGKGAR